MKKISVISILILLSIPLFSQASSGDVWFVPASSRVMIGSGFTTAVHANSGTQNLSAYGFDISFNHTIIAPNTALGNNSVDPGLNGFVSAVNPNTQGFLFITGFDAMGTGPGSDLHVITINWYANNIGSTSLGITVRDFADPYGNTIGSPRGISGNYEVAYEVNALGDVNEDGVINIIDALMVSQYYVGIIPATFNPVYADVDGNSSVNIIDALLIAQYYVGLITEFPGATNPTPTPVSTPEVTAIPGQETRIILNGNSVQVNGSGANVSGTNITITAAGNYIISGTLNDGRIIVDTFDESPVTLNLNGINIYSSVNSPLSVANAPGGTLVMLSENTTNYITDSSNYQFDDPNTDEPNAALFSKDDMDIAGTGTLIIDANYNDGIACKDDMNINDCTISVTAVDDGIRGKNSLEIKSGTNITVNSGGDCLKSDDAEDSLLEIKKCTLDLTSTGGDGMESEVALTVTHAEANVKITTTGTPSDTTSAKGIKGVQSILIETGTFTINSTDDAIHSNNSVVIWDGTFNISTGDDGIHGDLVLEINGGNINITKSYEGLEAETLTINNGNIRLYADDDGINAASSETNTGWPGNPGAYYIYINGGYSVVHITDTTSSGSTGGDGLDCNGYITMTGGTVIIHGNSNNVDSAIDYDGSFTMSGGFIIGAGTSTMAMAPGGSSSSQNALLYNFDAKNGLVNIQSSNGSSLATFMPDKQYQSIAFSSPNLVTGTTYNVYFGGSASGTVADGLYQNGTYNPGTLGTSFTVSGPVTSIGGGGWHF